jgi:anti-sigma factor RsiW
MIRDQTNKAHQPDHPTDALSALALGLLELDERAELETHLAGCAACREELARQEAVAGELGFAAMPVPPRPELRAALLSEIRQLDVNPASPRRFAPLTLALAAAAILAIASIVVLAALLARAIDERDDARYGEQRMAAYLADGGTLSPLLPAPDAAADVQAGNGSLAIAPSDDKAMVVVYDLPPTSDGWRYMAWAEHDGDRIRLGEIQVDDEGVGWLVFYPPEPMSTYETVGINRYPPDADDSEPFLIATVDQR